MMWSLFGVSGGPDSICLLHVLSELKKELNFEICVAHINHMLRDEADEETKYVENFCEKLGVQCFSKKINISLLAKELKKGTEETGRQMRYDFFHYVANNVGAVKIATAHNNNDKIETILMNILRGSGIAGIKGIPAVRNEVYIRPLIEISRQEIEEYCEENKLEPMYDKSNDENIYTRNKIRNVVIPYIQKEYNPNIFKTLNRLSEVVTEEDEYLSRVTGQTYNEIQISEHESNTITLDLAKFNKLELVIKRRVILYTINKVAGTTLGIEKVNIDDIIKLCSNNIGNKYITPVKNIKIVVKKGKIIFETNPE